MFLGVNLGYHAGRSLTTCPRSSKAFGQPAPAASRMWGWRPSWCSSRWPSFLNRVVLGRQILAAGGNCGAAQLSGLSVNGPSSPRHGISGALAAIAGMLLMARLALGTAHHRLRLGPALLRGTIIGGAALAGGSVSVVGTSLAVVLIALIQNALVILNADPYWVQFLLGGA